MSFFEKHKTTIIIGSAVTFVTLGILLLTGSNKKKDDVKEEKQKVNQSKNDNTQEIKDDQNQEQEENVKRGRKRNQENTPQPPEDPKEQEYQQEKNEADLSVKTKTSAASSKLKVQMLDGSNNFDFATVAAILESSFDYIDQEYIIYAKKNRQERRKVRTTDHERYKELVLEYNAQVEKFILTAQDQLLSDINIDKDQFESSVNSLLQNGYYQQLFMVQAAMRQKISEKLPRTKQVSKELIKEIIQYQLDILVNQKETFLQMISQLQFVPDIAELIPFILSTMIQDMIFEKFGIEEEDQSSQMNAQDVIDDPDIHQLLQQIEEAMLSLMQVFGLNYLDEEQELEEIEKLRELGQLSEN